MGRFWALMFVLCLTWGSIQGQKYPLDSLSLPAVDSSKEVSLKDYHDSKAVVVVFTGNHCVYSKKYEDRLILLAKEFAAKNVAFMLVNSNSPELSQDDRFELMKMRANEKAFPCPYLQDPKGAFARMAGASKNPEAFVFTYRSSAWVLAYSGKIDDNPLMDTRVEQQYLRNAVDAILAGLPAESTQPAVGCNIKQW